MAYLGNSPNKETILRLEARKSFTFALAVKDTHRRAVDLTGSTVRIVMKQWPLDSADTDDGDNLLAGNNTVDLSDAVHGYVRIDIQAAGLNWPTGEYPFVVVLVSPSGYSTVLVKGLIDLVQNTEFASLASLFPSAQPTQQLEVLLRGQTVFEVHTGATLPPGVGYMSDDDKDKLDALGVTGIWVGTEAQYAALPSIDPGTLYLTLQE